MKEVGRPTKEALLAAVPALRAFGVSLSGNPDRADDLVQETLLKAWSSLDSFAPGTNIRAWLFTILRNTFYSEIRKRKREIHDGGLAASRLSAPPEQPGHMDLLDFRIALAKLPFDQREAVILVGASGLSYEETAAICQCAVGTIKSRVNRARARLAELLGMETTDELGPDREWRALIGAAHATQRGGD